MITHLATYHDIRAIPIIRAFVAENGRFFGADDTEAKHLELAAEEAAGFIIKSLQPDKKELFEIEARVIDQGLCFSFRNKGLPVDEENLPVYDSRNPEDSLEGLPFLLLDSITDAMYFRNEGKNGWVLEFEKRFRRFTPLKEELPPDTKTLDACSKEKLSISIAQPKDAYGIIRLTYLTYKYTYVKSSFYFRKELENAIAKQQIISFIAKNSKGEIVVNSSYIRSPYSNSIAEAGVLMSRPDYRKNRALLKVARMQSDFLNKGSSGLRVAFSNLVTGHVKSQRLVTAFGYNPTAIKLSVHDRVKFVGMDTNSNERESLLYCLHIPDGAKPAIIHIPKEHLKITDSLISSFNNLTLSIAADSIEKEHSKFAVDRFESERYAVVIIEQIGRDWVDILRLKIRELIDSSFITIHVHFPSDKPLPSDFEKIIQKFKLFYSGIIIKTLDKWELVYTLLQGQNFNFDGVMLSDKKAIMLRDYMKSQYNKLKDKI